MANRLLLTDNVPRPFRYVTYEDYDTERGDPEAIKLLREWEEPCLLLTGPPGVAKTMLACATLHEHQAPYRCAVLKGDDQLTWCQEKFPVYFVQLAELVDLHLRSFRLHDQLMRDLLSDPTEYMEIDRLLQDLKSGVRLLVVDDVGKEHQTGTHFSRDLFDLLVRTRHNNGFRTIFTSNLPMREWDSVYSTSMKSFIRREALRLSFF